MDRLGHAGVKVKLELVEARHSRMRQKKARVTTGDQGESPGSLLCGRDAGWSGTYSEPSLALGFLFMQANAG